MVEEAAPLAPPMTVAPSARFAAVASQIRYVLVSMRPKQWTKSSIVFLAFIFSVNQNWMPEHPSSWVPLLARSALTALAFSMVSGADYLVNDIRDRESDALHPQKSRRPIAAGLLSPRAAISWAVAVSAVAIVGSFFIDWRTGGVMVGYLALMTAYTFYLKHEVILDVMTIAAGFVLRAVAGAYAINVPVSPWLYVVTALGALFLAITKRRAEVDLLEAEAIDHRSTLAHYTPALLDQMTAMVTASTVIAYALYTFTAANLPSNNAMMLTIPFVAYGIFRYLYLCLTKSEGGNPEEVLLKDVPLMLTVVGWVATSMAVLTLYR